MEAWSPFLQLGGSGFLLLVLWLIVRDGSLRTRFELETERERRKRAEDQVDTLLPALRDLTKAVEGFVADPEHHS